MNRGIMYSEGPKNVEAFLFDIALLFENFIREVLKNFTNLKVFNKKDGSFDVDFDNNNFPESRNMEPDIIVVDNSQQSSDYYIFDVKYKGLKKNNKVNRNDFYQVISYMSLFRNNFQEKEGELKGGGFIFPESFSGEEKIQEPNIFQGEISLHEDKDLYRAFFPVYDPKSDVENGEKVDFEEYQRRMKDIVEDFGKKFEEKIKDSKI